MALTKFIQLTGQVEALHRWPDAAAPDGYLAHPHRHLFVAELQISVAHDDRELEINAAARWITHLLASCSSTPPDGITPLDFGSQSCEQLATRLVTAVIDRYGRHRTARCAILEDGLLGGGAVWTPEPPHRP